MAAKKARKTTKRSTKKVAKKSKNYLMTKGFLIPVKPISTTTRRRSSFWRIATSRERVPDAVTLRPMVINVSHAVPP